LGLGVERSGCQVRWQGAGFKVQSLRFRVWSVPPKLPRVLAASCRSYVAARASSRAAMCFPIFSSRCVRARRKDEKKKAVAAMQT